MPEPITPTELPNPQRLTVGETPVYLKKPLVVDGQEITEFTIKGARQRTEKGVGSAMIVMEEKSRRRGEEGKPFTKMLDNVNAMEEVDWENVSAITFMDETGAKRHLLTRDQLSLVKPEMKTQPEAVLDIAKIPKIPETPQPSLSPESPPSPDVSPIALAKREPKLARRILETYSGEPTTLTIVGLKAYETRAHDLADKAMQLKTSLGDRIWKQGFGPAYFHEQARQYYGAMLKAANSPFAESSIKIAEAAGRNRYQELLKNKNFLTRPTRQFIEWMKDTLGMETLSQKFALEEIAHMRETGEIKEREVFDREAGAIRKRFEQDIDVQEQFIRSSLGEKLTILDPADEKHKPLVTAIKRLVKDYATGDIATKKDFDTITDQLFQKHLKTARRDVFDQAELYTASLYDVAENLRTKASHEGGLAAIDAQLDTMQVRLGMGFMGEATALVPSDVEKGTKAIIKTVDWLEKKGIIGPFVFNEATVSSAVALSLSLSFLPRMGLSTLANGVVSLGGGAAVGGIFAGLREYRHLEKEYLTHLREREAGLTFSPDAKRRAWMEKFMVGQRSADDLITGIVSSVYLPDGSTIKQTLTHDELRASMANLADAKARRALSSRTDRERVGLIQFTGRDNIETQRTALDLTIAQAEKDLTTYLTNHPNLPKDPNLPHSPDLPSLSDLTAAQTRILTDGLAKVEGLSDPIKVTLGLLDQYNPEVDIMRRRFPLIGAETKTGEKAQGLENIFNEFRRAARGEAVKKGLQVGLTSAALGFVAREVMQGGLETGAVVMTKEPVFAPPVHIGNADYQFANNLHMSGDNLVDAKGNTVIEKFNEILTNPNHAAYLKDGILTPEGKEFLIKQAHEYKLDIPAAIKTTYSFSGQTHMITNPTGGDVISVPKELDWKLIPGGRELVLQAKDAQGGPIERILYSETGDTTPLSLESILSHEPNILYRPPEDLLPNLIKSHDVVLPILPLVSTGEGVPLAIHASIPDGTNLVEIAAKGNIKVFDLVDAQGKQLLTGIEVNPLGVVQSYQTLNDSALAHANNLHVTMDQLTITTTPEAGSAVTGEFTKSVGDMGSTPGARGVWNWMLETMQNDGNVKHLLPATNLTKNLFRGYEENMIAKGNVFLTDGSGHVTQVANAMNLPYGAMGDNYQFHDLPKSLFFDQSIDGKIPLVELGKLMDKAIEIKEIQHFDLDHLTAANLATLKLTDKEAELLSAAFSIGRVGNVATADQVKMFMEYMGSTGGGAEKTVTIWRPVIEQAVTETVPAHVVGVSGEHVSNLIALHEAITVPELPFAPYTLLWRNPLEASTPLIPFEPKPGVLPPPAPELPSPYLFAPGREPYGPDTGQRFTNAEVLDYYRSRRHPKLNENPRIRLPYQEAVDWYLDRQTKEYQQTLVTLNETIGTPMNEQAKIAVCIPVAGHQEAKNIYRTLSQYTKQTDLEGKPLDPANYEVILFVNAPEGQSITPTIDEISRFRKDYPSIPVRVATGAFQKGTVRYGAYIKYAYDLALLRARKRQITNDIVIATMDADTAKMDPTYLSENFRFMSDPANARFDATLAMQDFDHRVLAAYPTFMATVRFRQYIEAQTQRGIPGWNTAERAGEHFPTIITQGRTSFIRGSTLAAIGGVNSSTPAGTDKELGEMITFARTGKFQNIPEEEYPLAYNNESGIQTNPRRELVTMLSGKLLTETWDKFDEGEQVRGKSIEELIGQSPEKPGELNIPQLERQINGFRAWGVNMDSYYARRALSWMGLTEGTDYLLEKDDHGAKVKFTGDLKTLKNELVKFAEKTHEVADRVDPTILTPQETPTISSVQPK
ncbi:hypothetical protein HY949_01410 [Candidatus Gottesmanbacteria bacterium]|nr:hypothetical protein [Candidatus Gottesmanbacteria bacterium]